VYIGEALGQVGFEHSPHYLQIRRYTHTHIYTNTHTYRRNPDAHTHSHHDHEKGGATEKPAHTCRGSSWEHMRLCHCCSSLGSEVCSFPSIYIERDGRRFSHRCTHVALYIYTHRKKREERERGRVRKSEERERGRRGRVINQKRVRRREGGKREEEYTERRKWRREVSMCAM